MAILNHNAINYMNELLKNSNPSGAWGYDPLFQLAERCREPEQRVSFYKPTFFQPETLNRVQNAYQQRGIVGVLGSYFEQPLVASFAEVELERRALCFKRGYPSLPATKASLILQGFGHKISTEQVLAIYGSYGLARNQKRLAESSVFLELNGRLAGLARLLRHTPEAASLKQVQQRYLAMGAYLAASSGHKEQAIRNSGLKRSLFFLYWTSFKRYGVLGLIDKVRPGFRQSKIGLANESRLVVDKLQHPQRAEAYYVGRLASQGIVVERSAVAKMFSRWEVKNYRSCFLSNLTRLEREAREEDLPSTRLQPQSGARYVDAAFVRVWDGLRKRGRYVDAPGLFVLWSYLEEMGLVPILNRLGLANADKGYSWLDHFLLNVGRIFYGLPSYHAAWQHEEPSLSLFAHLSRWPAYTCFLEGLRAIGATQLFQLQQWLINRMQELGIIQGKRLAFDFHQIDLDVEFERLRQIGKGPSPKKKVCYNGFRPHIAWDLDTGTVIVLEFRKASARGTTTVARFVNDFLMTGFRDVFEEVYIDSEYTGKDVWNLVLDNHRGMGAELTACLKQNPFVKKYRDRFLAAHQDEPGFWRYYDDDHLYSSSTFCLSWNYVEPQTLQEKEFSLNVVLKKNIHNGKLRCFASSNLKRTSCQILEAYTQRWSIENGIKDLVHSYFLDQCPGLDPHLVNVHFFTVMVCRLLFRMIQRDLGTCILNPDGSIKTLKTMRQKLFRQGSAQVNLEGDTLKIYFQNSYSVQLTQNLKQFYQHCHNRNVNGLEILGGYKIKFELLPPAGDETKNALKKTPLSSVKISEPLQK